MTTTDFRTSQSRYDVVIVGARAAGAATAMLLARQGRRVLLVDRAQYGSDTLSTHALMRAGVLQLGRWGLLDRIVAAGTPAVRHIVFHYGDDDVAVAIQPTAGVDALYAPRRTVLDPILVDAARQAGAEVRFGILVTGLRHERAGRVAGVTGRDADGKAFAVDAGLTIGADGLGSTVARLVTAPIVRHGTGASAFIYGYWSNLDVEGYEWFYRQGGSAGMIPTNDGQVCIFAGTTRTRFRAEIAGDVRAGFDTLLGEVSPAGLERIRRARPPARLRSFPGRPGYLRQAWGLGWALVGDAGYFKDPISTHGLTDALRDAELLAASIDDVDAGLPQDVALANYQSERDRLSTQLFDTVDAIARYEWDLVEVKRLLREMGAAMTDEVETLGALDGPAFTSPLATVRS